MAKNMTGERRKYFRLDVSAKVVFKVKDKKTLNLPREAYESFSKNISIEGVCFISPTAPKLHKAIELKIYLPGEKRAINLVGKTKWCRVVKKEDGEKVFEVGVELSTISKTEEGRFIGYVSSKMAAHLGKYLHL
jgi:c-di-GMP-binding flagellar brake protein YcgR